MRPDEDDLGLFSDEAMEDQINEDWWEYVQEMGDPLNGD